MTDSNKKDIKKAETSDEDAQPKEDTTIYVLEVETKEGKRVEQQVASLVEGHQAGVRAVESGLYTFPIPGGVQVVTCTTAKVYNRPAPTTTPQV